jgi:hypothetical protein
MSDAYVDYFMGSDDCARQDTEAMPKDKPLALLSLKGR